MKIKNIFLLLEFFIIHNAFSQMDSLYSLVQVNNMTCYIEQKINDSTLTFGTGTIISHNGNYFILTASHVAKSIKSDGVIALTVTGNKAAVIKLISVSNLNWIHHPVADMAILKLTPFEKEVSERFKNHSFPSYLILRNKEHIDPDIALDFLGYPIVDLELEYFAPIVVRGFPTSGMITQNRYDTKTKCILFFLNVPSMQGASGGGVYYSLKRDSWYKKTLLVGIVHGTRSDDTGGKMAAITPSFYIWDLLNKSQ